LARERPERMKRQGRPIDPEFLPTEKLFRRYQSTHIIGGAFTGVGLSFDDAPSVNRAKYSEAGDVLFSEAEEEFAGWGVLSWESQQIPTPLPEPPEQPRFNIRSMHVPLENNYAHSELHCARLDSEEYCEPDRGIGRFCEQHLASGRPLKSKPKSDPYLLGKDLFKSSSATNQINKLGLFEVISPAYFSLTLRYLPGRVVAQKP
jgi:hypothetical protein